MRIAKRWAVCLLLATPSLRAQSPVRIAPFQLTVGGDDENYLRYLQSRGLVSPYPWAIRPFAPSELARLAPARDSQPWTFWDSVPTARISVRALPMTLAARFNSSFPYGSNDGPIWAGRGLTSSIEGGIAIQVGPLSAILDPIAFRAENQSFVLYPNGQPGNLAFGDALLPHSIDHPQRFGSGAYARVDPGQISSGTTTSHSSR